MFFNTKKLIAQKEQLNDKIQDEYKRMDVTYQQLKLLLKAWQKTITICSLVWQNLPRERN